LSWHFVQSVTVNQAEKRRTKLDFPVDFHPSPSSAGEGQYSFAKKHEYYFMYLFLLVFRRCCRRLCCFGVKFSRQDVDVLSKGLLLISVKAGNSHWVGIFTETFAPNENVQGLGKK